jgi:hypothetical protein
VMHIPRPMVTLCFLEQPVEFGAMDGQPVHTLFTIVSPTIRARPVVGRGAPAPLRLTLRRRRLP